MRRLLPTTPYPPNPVPLPPPSLWPWAMASACTSGLAPVCRLCLCRDDCAGINSKCTTEEKEHQNASVVQALRFMTAGLPVLVSLLSLLAMQWYHIDEVR